MLALFSQQQYAMVATTPKLTPGGPEVAKTMAGVTGPFGFFDPLGLTPDTKEELLMFREAELAHSRVAMVVALSFLEEKFHPPRYDRGR